MIIRELITNNINPPFLLIDDISYFIIKDDFDVDSKYITEYFSEYVSREEDMQINNTTKEKYTIV